MAFQDEVQILTRLGLTSNQAKIYIALCNSGISNAKQVSKNSNVERSETYRVIAKLENLGLVERIISAPCKFRTISIQDSLSLLMKRRIEETCELKKITKELLLNFKNNNEGTALKEDEPQFIVMSEQAGKRKRTKELETVQRSSDLTVPWKHFLHNKLSNKNLGRALQRGIEFRTIIDTPPGRKNQKALSDTIKQLKKYPNFKVRYLPSTPKATMLMHDQKDAWIFCGTQACRKEGNDLYTNNPCLLSILQDYFEILWLKAIEYDY